MIVLGIDPGMTSRNPTGLAVVDCYSNDLLASMTVPIIKKAPWTRQLTMIAEAIVVALDSPQYDIAGAAYELPHVANNPRVAIQLAHVGGVVVGICALRGIPCIGISPAEAKLALAGHGAADKEAMMRATKNIFGRLMSKDEADAAGVALAGQGSLFRRQLLETT